MLQRNQIQKISPYHLDLQYSGRIKMDYQGFPLFVYPSTYVKIRFWGKSCSVLLSNFRIYWSNYLGVFVDGEQLSYNLPEQGDCCISLLEEAEPSVHEICIFKRMDACHLMQFKGFLLNSEAVIYPCDPMPNRRIEVYGDSVSAGEVSEALAYCGLPDPIHDGEYSNSYYSYAWIVARKLKAELHNISQGGIALRNRTGWFYAPEYIGLESTYDTIQYVPQFGDSIPWDFTEYAPHIVIVAIGQNDSHPNDYMAADYDCADSIRWRRSYMEFLLQLRLVHPKSFIICKTTILEHHLNWDRSIKEVCDAMKDDKLCYFSYSNTGCGTKGHIRIPEAEKMAEELSSFILSLGESIWQD